MKSRSIKLMTFAFFAASVTSNAFAQDDDGSYSEATCARITLNCINNYSAMGYPRANECFTAVSDGNCPDRGGSDGSPRNNQNGPSGPEATLCGGTQGRLGGCG